MTTHSFTDAQLAARARNAVIREQCCAEHYQRINRQPAQSGNVGLLLAFVLVGIAVLALLWKAWPL